jgi:hypothetical protein
MEVVRAEGARADPAKPDAPRNEAAGTIDSKSAKPADPATKN